MGITRPGQEFHRGYVEEQGRLAETTFEKGAGGVERASQDEYHDTSPVASTPFLAFTHAPKQHRQETTIGQHVTPEGQVGWEGEDRASEQFHDRVGFVQQAQFGDNPTKIDVLRRL